MTPIHKNSDSAPMIRAISPHDACGEFHFHAPEHHQINVATFSPAISMNDTSIETRGL